MDIEKMYNDFRIEIEKICTPEILKQVTTIKLIKDDKDVGILCYIPQNGYIYIDALYIIPEYRRKGVGKGAVLNWYEDFKDDEIRLHIVNTNYPALSFWHSVFELEAIENNSIDTLYRIKGAKEKKHECS